MNNYERLGKTLIVGVIVFVLSYFFSAGVVVVAQLSQVLTAWESMNTCLVVGGIFGLLGLAFGWMSIPDLWKS